MHPRIEILVGLLFLAFGATVACAQGVAQGVAQSGSKPVLELFTSQGCSSCPPADVLLKTYAERSDVIALSMPVDYWDHLGWKDTMASPRNTARQKAYARSLATGNIYTPQVVINGAEETVGSNKPAIEKAIASSSRAIAASRIEIAGNAQGNKVTVEVGSAGQGAPAQSATIWLAIVEPRVDVEIKHGENRGRKLTYYNVVRGMTPVGMWSGKPVTLELPQGAEMQAGKKCAVLLQSGDAGRILAATWVVAQR